MKCVDCGRELEDLHFSLTENEVDTLQLAVSRKELGIITLKPENINKYNFDSIKNLYTYIKNSLELISESEFLISFWEYSIRKKYNYPYEEGEFTIVDKKAYRHIG